MWNRAPPGTPPSHDASEKGTGDTRRSRSPAGPSESEKRQRSLDRRTCQECGLTFARNDSLRRHLSVHHDPNRVRRSRAKACAYCAASKLKCDGALPSCRRCTERSHPCSYPDRQALSRASKERTDRSRPTSASASGANLDLLAASASSRPQPTTPRSSAPAFQQTAYGSIFPGAGLSGSGLPYFNNPYLPGVSNGPLEFDQLIHFDEIMPGFADVGTFDSTDLGIESSNMFWSDWESLGVNTGGAVVAEEDSGRAPSVSRAPSPAFFETDEAGRSMLTWHTAYDAARDDGDLLGGKRQLNLANDARLDVTVEVMKARWPALEAFTFDARSKSKIVEAVIFSGIPPREQQGVYRTLSRLKDTVYLHFYSLYLQNVQARLPFLHLPTLDPAIDSGLLSLAILSVGALYSDMSGARQFAIIMIEIARRGCDHLMMAHPSYSRDLQVVQAQLISSMSRWGGQGREVEIYERYRFVYCTLLRRMMGFQPLTMPTPPSESDGSEQARWRAWRKFEQLKRTALSCYILEVEAAVLAQLGSSVRTSELELSLPCPASLWEAPNAAEWMGKYQPPSLAGQIPIRRLLNEFDRFSSDPQLRSDPFSALILCNMLLASSSALMELEYCAPLAFSATLIELNAVQSRLSNGQNDFIPWFDRDASSTSGQGFVSAALTYHASALLRYALPYQLLAIVGRGKLEWNVKAREQLSQWMLQHPLDARRLSLHAGQALRLFRETPYQCPEEGWVAFFSVIYIYMLIKVQPFTPWPGGAAPPISLDGPLVNNPGPWLTLGYPPQLSGVGNLDSPLAAHQLVTGSGEMLSRRIWSNDRFLGTMLVSLGKTERMTGH